MDITLRPVRIEDEGRFLALAQASLPFHDGLVTLPKTPGAFASYVSASDGISTVRRLVCGDGEIVGIVNINGIVRESYQRGVLGYAAFVPYAGKGFMTEGVRQAVRYAFGPLDLHRVEADIQPGNIASSRLVARLGFRLEGLSPGFIKINGKWRDHQRWAISRSEFMDLEISA